MENQNSWTLPPSKGIILVMGYGFKLSAVTGNSINTAFSLVASNLPLSYMYGGWWAVSHPVYMHFGKSLPTTTITDKIIIPEQSTYTYDSNHGQPATSDGVNLYIAAASTPIDAGTIIINFAV